MLNATEALYLALRSEHGIALQCLDFTRTRAMLYAARKALADPTLSALTFSQGKNGELWILKKKRDVT